MFPVGHTVIHVGDACKDNESCLRMEALIKCSVILPEGLYNPVLPFRTNKKLTFCLCRTCVLNYNTGEWCTTNEERGLTGTWVIDKVPLHVHKGYMILEFHEVYEYNVTRHKLETREGGLFAGYIDIFLKLKAEAIVYHACVESRSTKTDIRNRSGRMRGND